MANLKPTNEEFSDSSYNNDSRLSQPSSGVRQVRNVQTDKGYDPDKRRGGAEERAASTWGASMQAGEDKAEREEEAQTARQENQASGIRSVATTQQQNAGGQARQSIKSVVRKAQGKKGKGIKSKGSRLVGRTVTLSIWSWGFFIWLWFQLPITILSILFMAMTEAIYQAYASLTTSSASDGFVTVAAKFIGSALATTLDSILELVNALMDKFFDFNLDVLNPANFFMLTHILLVLVGWGMLLAMAIIYTMTGQKAFSGKGAGGKNALFILAFIGYAIPILNILPLFFFWTLAVLKNPR